MVALCGVLALVLTSATATATAASPSWWSAPTVADPVIEHPTDSCPSSSFCAAVGGTGMATTFDGSSWTKPAKIDSGGLSAVSCTSSTFCMAVGADSRVFDGTTWREIPTPIGELHSVSCTSSSFCVAESGWNVLIFDGRSWSSPQKVLFAGFPAGVSCASSTFCVATDQFGYAATYDGNAWSSPVATGMYLFSVSCPAQNFCVAAGGIATGPGTYGTAPTAGGVTTFDGRAWSRPEKIAPLNPGSFGSVTCTSQTFCVVTGDGTYAYDGSGWRPYGNGVPRDGDFVSCASSSFCMEMNPQGLAGRLEGERTLFVLGGGGHDRVSCATPSFCTAVDHNGAAVTFDGRSWSKAMPINPGVPLTSVSCPATTFCATVGNYQAETFNGGGWRASRAL